MAVHSHRAFLWLSTENSCVNVHGNVRIVVDRSRLWPPSRAAAAVAPSLCALLALAARHSQRGRRERGPVEVLSAVHPGAWKATRLCGFGVLPGLPFVGPVVRPFRPLQALEFTTLKA